MKMNWKSVNEEPKEDRPLLLFGIRDNGGAEVFAVGGKDNTYGGVATECGPPMEVTHWAYIEKPNKCKHGTYVNSPYNPIFISYIDKHCRDCGMKLKDD